MGSNSAALVEVSTLSRPQTAMEIRAQINLIQEVMQAAMKKDVHYGVVPGCGDKPTLLKPGAEKLASTFRIAVEPVVEDLSTPDEYRVRVYARCTSMATGAYLGSGIGECSSNEEKYKWRAAVCEQEFEETAIDRKRLKWKKGYNNRPPQQITQIRTEKQDVANTVLKMGKKRALVDAILTVTAASDIFQQDIEEIPEELRIEVAEESQAPRPTAAPTAMPQRKANATTPQTTPAVQAAQPSANPPTAQTGNTSQKIEGLACPDCGETLQADGCHFCGWQPEKKSEPQQPQQQRQEPERHREAPSQSARKEAGPVISEAQGKRFFAICMGNGITKPEMTAYLKQRFGIDNTRDIPKAGYEEACKWAAEGK